MLMIIIFNNNIGLLLPFVKENVGNEHPINFLFKSIFGVEFWLNLLIIDKFLRPPIIPNSSIPLVKFVENFNNAMMVRENADYRTRFSK